MQPMNGDAGALAARLRKAGLPVRPADTRLLIGFGGLTDAAARQIEARIG
jgi:hypothetical protein